MPLYNVFMNREFFFINHFIFTRIGYVIDSPNIYFYYHQIVNDF